MADTKLSALPDASALDAAHQAYLVQGSTSTKVPLSDLSAFISPVPQHGSSTFTANLLEIVIPDGCVRTHVYTPDTFRSAGSSTTVRLRNALGGTDQLLTRRQHEQSVTTGTVNAYSDGSSGLGMDFEVWNARDTSAPTLVRGRMVQSVPSEDVLDFVSLREAAADDQVVAVVADADVFGTVYWTHYFN